jgi:acetyl esterase/lipase
VNEKEVVPSGASADAAPTPSAVISYKKIGDVVLDLHVFNPPGHTPSDTRPAIVFFFGGGWSGGTPTQFFPQSSYLASRGMVAISAEYRVNTKHNTPPSTCVADGKSAVRWIRANASQLGIDPERLAAGGGSAGAHVAAATALTKRFDEPGEDTGVSCRPEALVLFNPVFDNGPSGFGHDRVKEYWQDFSPMHNIARGAPPTLIMLGTEDSIIPVSTAQRYQKLMAGVGARCDVRLYEGQGHGFFNKARYKETVIEADKFLTSLGYIEGEPTLKP